MKIKRGDFLENKLNTCKRSLSKQLTCFICMIIGNAYEYLRTLFKCLDLDPNYPELKIFQTKKKKI